MSHITHIRAVGVGTGHYEGLYINSFGGSCFSAKAWSKMLNDKGLKMAIHNWDCGLQLPHCNRSLQQEAAEAAGPLK